MRFTKSKLVLSLKRCSRDKSMLICPMLANEIKVGIGLDDHGAQIGFLCQKDDLLVMDKKCI